MKRYLLAILGASLLGACVPHETDVYAAQEKRNDRLSRKRAEVGCTFVRDHDAYRQCVLNTYQMQHPSTYETHELSNGQPVAVVGNAPAPCQGPACRTMRVAPLPSVGPQIAPYSTMETTTVETNCTKNYQRQEASLVTTEVLPPPAPVQIITQAETVVPVQPVVAPVPAVEPDPDPTWWETYQAKKKPEPAPQKPVCPCPDPNDPCPQCFDK